MVGEFTDFGGASMDSPPLLLFQPPYCLAPPSLSANSSLTSSFPRSTC